MIVQNKKQETKLFESMSTEYLILIKNNVDDLMTEIVCLVLFSLFCFVKK